MEILRMEIIFNIAKMREVITGAKMDFDNLKKYDVYTMNYDQLYELQNSLIPEYNKAIRA